MADPSTTQKVTGPIKKALMGDVLGYPHPIHGALVHFPLTFFAGAFAIDSLRLLTTPTGVRVFGVINALKVAGLTQVGWWMHVAGLVTSLPAVATGFAEYSAMNGASPATTTALYHAGLNMLVFGTSAWSVLSRRGVPLYVPKLSHAVVGVLGLGVTGVSGYLGSNLVYKYGTGVQRQGSSLDVMARQQRGEEVAPQAGQVHGFSGGEYPKDRK